jgi:hypothetical protein
MNVVNPLIINFCLDAGISLFRIILGPLVLIKGGVLNAYYQYAVFITNVSLIAEFFCIILSFNFFKNNKFINDISKKVHCNKNIKRQRMIFFATAFFVFSIFCFCLLANTSYTIPQWIKIPRIGYQFHRTGAGHWYALFILFLGVSFTMCLLYVKNIKYSFIILFLYLFFVRLFGSKGRYLEYFVAFYSVLWLRQYKYLKIIVIMGIPILIILMTYMFGYSGVMDVINYFDYYYNSTLYFTEYFNDRLNLFHGKIFLTGLWGLIPRSLFPNKPYVYGITLINEIFYPGSAAKTHTPAFGGPIAAFADFGIFGVVVSSLFNIKTIIKTFCYYLVFFKYNIEQIKKSVFLILILLYVVAPGFLTFFQFPMTTMLIILIFYLIEYFSKMDNRILLTIKNY